MFLKVMYIFVLARFLSMVNYQNKKLNLFAPERVLMLVNAKEIRLILLCGNQKIQEHSGRVLGVGGVLVGILNVQH